MYIFVIQLKASKFSRKQPGQRCVNFSFLVKNIPRRPRGEVSWFSFFHSVPFVSGSFVPLSTCLPLDVRRFRVFSSALLEIFPAISRPLRVQLLSLSLSLSWASDQPQRLFAWWTSSVRVHKAPMHRSDAYTFQSQFRGFDLFALQVYVSAFKNVGVLFLMIRAND